MKQVIETLDDVWAVNITIDGKRYNLHETYTSARAASNEADKIRKRGTHLARVRKVKNIFDRNYIPFKFLYRVYTRRK